VGGGVTSLLPPPPLRQAETRKESRNAAKVVRKNVIFNLIVKAQKISLSPNKQTSTLTANIPIAYMPFGLCIFENI
jgi:hypothetical protein